MAFDGTGRLWATTGGGSLVRLDATTGQILQKYGDGITIALAVQKSTGLIFVSTNAGVSTFDPETGIFTHGAATKTCASAAWRSTMPARCGR